MAHPGDHGRLGPPLDRDALGPGDRAAADRGGVIGDGSCQALAKLSVVRRKRQERHYRPEEILDIFRLGLRTAPGPELAANPTSEPTEPESQRPG